MKFKAMSLKTAHDLVKSKRKVVKPNIGFWRQLVDYEMQLFGKNSVHMMKENLSMLYLYFVALLVLHFLLFHVLWLCNE